MIDTPKRWAFTDKRDVQYVFSAIGGTLRRNKEAFPKTEVLEKP
jgi:hypothetical protein